MNPYLDRALAEALTADRLRSARESRSDVSSAPFKDRARRWMPSTAPKVGSGIAVLIGGIAWIAFAILANAKPVGCVGAECATRIMRETGDIDILLLTGAVLIPGSLLAMALHACDANKSSKLWRIGAAGATIASIALVGASLAAPDSEAAWMLVVFPSMIALVLGLAVAGIGIASDGALPRAAGVVIALSALALFAANDQDERVLLCIPVGLAAIATGILALRDTAPSSIPGAPRPTQAI
jgi:hypothetical protein